MIVDDRGEVVWFRPLRGRYDGRAHDLKVQSYRGKSVLTWMEGVANEYVIADHTYREIARISAGCSPFTSVGEIVPSSFLAPIEQRRVVMMSRVRWWAGSRVASCGGRRWRCEPARERASVSSIRAFSHPAQGHRRHPAATDRHAGLGLLSAVHDRSLLWISINLVTIGVFRLTYAEIVRVS